MALLAYGLLAVYLIIVIFSLLNYWSVKLLTSFTSLISVFKLGVPMLTIIMLMLVGFDTSNYGHSASTFMPYGSAPIFVQQQHQGLFFHSIHSRQLLIWVQKLKILKKISQEASLFHCQSVQCCTSFYKVRLSLLCLNQCYNIVDGMASTSIHHLQLAILLGINWLAILLYIEAFVSPFGTGVSFVAVTGRVLRAMEKNGHIPKFLGKMNEKYHIPRVAIIFNAIISMIMVTLFRDWGTLAAVISTATLVAYLTGPTTVIALRKMGPTMTRPFRAKILKVMAPLSFVLASLAIYWAMWPTTAEVLNHYTWITNLLLL